MLRGTGLIPTCCILSEYLSIAKLRHAYHEQCVHERDLSPSRKRYEERRVESGSRLAKKVEIGRCLLGKNNRGSSRLRCSQVAAARHFSKISPQFSRSDVLDMLVPCVAGDKNSPRLDTVVRCVVRDYPELPVENGSTV